MFNFAIFAGVGRFFRPAVSLVAYVAQPHGARSASLGEKSASSRIENETSTNPIKERVV